MMMMMIMTMTMMTRAQSGGGGENTLFSVTPYNFQKGGEAEAPSPLALHLRGPCVIRRLWKVRHFIQERFLQKMNIYMRLLRMVIACICVHGVNAEIYDILPYH